MTNVTTSNEHKINHAPKLKMKSDNIVVEPSKIKRLATEKNPTIEAIISGMFKFERKEQALARIEAIKNYFVISSKLPKDGDENTLKLWIRGFGIDEKEEKEGYLGNYAAIKVKEVDGKFTLIAEKQRIALKYHPQRIRPKQKHPDWGHPALRIVKKGLIFDRLEDAQKILNQIHEEYPDVTIPNPDKLYVIIYGKIEGDKSPIHKYILEIKSSREGGFFIEYNLNQYSKAKDKEEVVETTKSHKAGYFTSMVELKKSKKKNSAKKKPKNS